MSDITKSMRGCAAVKVIIIVAIAVGLAVAAYFVLRRGGEKPSETPQQTVVDRMKDPEYVKVLNTKLRLQNELAARAHALAAELEKVKKENPLDEKVKELEKKYNEVVAEIERQRKKAMETVRERILKDTEPNKK
jgi:hypothetical protein